MNGNANRRNGRPQRESKSHLEWTKRSNRRVLSPEQAVLPGITAYATSYVGTHLAVFRSEKRPGQHEALIELLKQAGKKLGWKVRPQPEGERTAHLPNGVIVVEINAKPGQPEPDSWRLLQKARAMARKPHGGPDDEEFADVKGAFLNHVVSPVSPRGFEPNTLHEPNPVQGPTTLHEPNPVSGTSSVAVASYLSQGSGGRQPIAYVGPAPYRLSDDEFKTTYNRRRPVVAVLDTGCWSEHPWFKRQAGKDPQQPVVYTDVAVQTRTPDGETMMQIGDPRIDRDDWALPDEFSTDRPLDGTLSEIAGHGTFVAGLIHQACPDADILQWRVVPPDGEMEEAELLIALCQIIELVRQNRDDENTGHAIDVLSLSLSYYHETPENTELIDDALRELLTELGSMGVTVVCSAGNDATSRPAFPAAFGPWRDGKPFSGDPGIAPIVSVGALNPDGEVDALFSNVGPWVRHYERGAVLMSTFPDVQGGYEPIAKERIRDGDETRERSSMDPDDFRSGFAVWSGTSFSAPIVAGKIAAELHESQPVPGHLDVTPETAWAAVTKVTELTPYGDDRAR